ncbi:MAG: methyltransferase domain-containing protein [Actinobacteria bacterium]|nr:methyltransferase domain-containing protein [Actinomycetota bacterium]
MKTASSVPGTRRDTGVRRDTELLMSQLAGYVAVRTVGIGLRYGLFARLAAHRDGMRSATLAAETNLNRSYVEVWCRAACAAQLLEATDSTYRLDKATATLLLDRDSDVYLGGLLKVIVQPEVFDWFADKLPTGDRTWWDHLGPEFIAAVSEVTRPAHIRLIPGGLSRIADLQETLANGPRILDLACGTGFGLTRLAETYPSAQLIGIDGDAYSLGVAADRLDEAGIADRVELRLSTLEDFDQPGEFDLIAVNYSMHECSDIEKVTDNVHRGLRRGGFFVISDFPFPDRQEGLRTPPGTIMSGIQFHEALIGDQLLPVQTFVELLERHEFHAVDSFMLAPMHAVIHGRRSV